ncbi:MAG: hypothetical protein II947_07245, partial [Bacteroidaceae bacterium]|nr:hypothetical protein [Bacteroidaceae bacterium]
ASYRVYSLCSQRNLTNLNKSNKYILKDLKRYERFDYAYGELSSVVACGELSSLLALLAKKSYKSKQIKQIYF